MISKEQRASLLERQGEDRRRKESKGGNNMLNDCCNYYDNDLPEFYHLAKEHGTVPGPRRRHEFPICMIQEHVHIVQYTLDREEEQKMPLFFNPLN